MKHIFKIVLSLLMIGMLPYCLFAQYEPKKIHDLNGFIDSSGTTHLFYRLYEVGTEMEDGRTAFKDHVYHYNTASRSDNLFYEEYLDVRPDLPNESLTTTDFTFIFNELTNKVYSQVYCNIHCSNSTHVNSKDSTWVSGFYPSGFWSSTQFTINPRHSGIIYQATPAFADPDSTRQLTNKEGRIIAGFDSPDSIRFSYSLRSIDPHHEGIRFGLKKGNIIRISNTQKTVIVDSTLGSRGTYEFNYSKNTDMVFLSYQKIQDHKPQLTRIYRSSNAGKVGSWKVMAQDSSEIAFEADTSTEKIYLSHQDTLFISTDQGKSFRAKKVFAHRITDIFIPGTKNKYYISTTSNIFKKQDNESFTSIKHINVAIKENNSTRHPSRIKLLQNYPNPFNPSTQIEFSLPRASHVQLTVYNAIGQKVSTLVNGPMNPGSHSVSFDASGLPSGVYIYRLKAGSFTQSRKMLLVK